MKNICERPTTSLIWNMAHEFSMTYFSSYLSNSTANSEVSVKIQTMSLVLNVFEQRFIYFIYLFYLLWRHLLPAAEKRFKPVKLFFQSREWSKSMCSFATTDTAHAQRSYLIFGQLAFAEWRSHLYIKKENITQHKHGFSPTCELAQRLNFFPMFHLSCQFFAFENRVSKCQKNAANVYVNKGQKFQKFTFHQFPVLVIYCIFFNLVWPKK